MNIFNEKSKILVKELEAEIGSGEFDVIKYIEPVNLGTICSEDIQFNFIRTTLLFYRNVLIRNFKIAETGMGVDCDVRNGIGHTIRR
jgi:hypothetical protein